MHCARSIGWKLLPMLGERHVFDPLLAAILDQRERQGVLASAAKVVDARAVAEFRGLAACFLDCDSIPSHCQIASVRQECGKK